MLVAPRKRRGTSLLEVFMVIAILTGSLSIIGVSGAFSHRVGLKHDTDEVVRCLRLARETALTCGCDIQVRTARRNHPTSGQRCVLIELLAQPSPYTDAVDSQNVGHFGIVSVNPAQWMVDPIWLNRTTRLSADVSEIVFRSDGVASQDVTWTLSSDGQSQWIRVDAVTGNIFSGVSP